MVQSPELPDCFYLKQPVLISPDSPTPKHSLYLSNLDDQKFLRFSIKYLYLFRKAISTDTLKLSLSRVLVEYYPLAGRLRTSPGNDEKLEVECNGAGALFAEAFLDVTADEFLGISNNKPNRSWRKLLYRVEAPTFLDIPPLVIQVTNLGCGGMILCTGINHCLCDGIGTSQFLNAWAHLTRKPTTSDLPIKSFHVRHVLGPRCPPRVTSTHPGYTNASPDDSDINVIEYLQSQPLVPVSLTFSPSEILQLKKQCSPSLKCTTFEVLAAHTWRCWVRSLDLPSALNVKLLFSVNVRKRMKPELPEGYYGNGFVLACAESMVKELVASNMRAGVKMVQQAKEAVNDEYVRSVVDLMEEDRRVRTDLTTSLVISQWSRLGLEDVDFGQGRPSHMASLTTDVYCLFLPVVGELDAVRVAISMPENVVHEFEFYMTEFADRELLN